MSIPPRDRGGAYALTNRISHFHFPPSMYAAKKCKISGSGLELEMSLTQLRKLRKTLIPEEVPESDAISTDTFSDRLDNMITLLKSQVNDPLV